MSRSKPIKILALTNFIMLLAVFLAYRGGYFDNYIYNYHENKFSSSNGGAMPNKTSDSIPAKNDSLFKGVKFVFPRPVVSAGSIKFDTGITKRFSDPPNSVPQLTEEQIRMLSSSKSGLIFEPKLFISDSVYRQLRFQKKKRKKH